MKKFNPHISIGDYSYTKNNFNKINKWSQTNLACFFNKNIIIKNIIIGLYQYDLLKQKYIKKTEKNIKLN